MNAPLFSTGAGTQIVTDNVLPNDTPGSLTINAQAGLDAFISFFSNSLPIVPNVSNMKSNVSLVGTTVRAGDVVIDSDADAADLYDDTSPETDGNFGKYTAETSSTVIGSISLFAGLAISKAESLVTINGGSIQSSNLSVTSDARTEATTRAVSHRLGAVAVGLSKPRAEVNVLGGANIVSTGNIALRSEADGDLNVSTLLRGRKFGGVLSFGFFDLDAKSSTSSDAVIRAAGTLDVTAKGTRLNRSRRQDLAFSKPREWWVSRTAKARRMWLHRLMGTSPPVGTS